MEQSFKNMRAWLERLEHRSPLKAGVVLAMPVALAVLAIHVVLKFAEGERITVWALFNTPLESLLVAVPLLYLARRTIRELAQSRGELQVLSERLKAAAEAAQESSRAKSAFLANMSHELRTPLNAILGFSEIMKDQHLGPVSNPRYLSYAGDIHTSGRHLLGIINDVLDLAKIESGKMSLDNAAEFALVPALSSALSMLAGLGEKNGVTLDGELGVEDIRLVAVERMVHQIILNLVGNAIKFTPKGGQVALRGAARPDGGYALSVRDTGIGMSESEIANALIAFGQNRTKKAKHQEGTGLGLPLAKAMIELHGGSLAIESQPDHGTCVTVIFPAARVVRARAQAAA